MASSVLEKAAALVDQLGDTTPSKRTEVVRAILELLRDSDEDSISRVGEWLSKYPELTLPPLIAELNQKDSARARAAARLLWHFDESAKVALSSLLKCLKSPDEQLRAWAAHAIGLLKARGSEYGEQLERLLTDPSDSVRASALFALGKVYGSDPRVIQPSIAAVSDPSARMRTYALWNLIRLADAPRSVVTAIAQALEDPELEIRQTAAQGLAKMGPPARSTGNLLLRAIAREPDELVHLRMVEAYWKTTEDTEPVLHQLRTRLLSSPNSGVLEGACDIVRSMGSKAAEVVPLVTKLLQHEEADIVWAAADGLAAVGADAADAIPFLIPLLEHESGTVASSAASALGAIGAPAVPELIRVLEQGTERAQEFAADALSLIGLDAHQALPAIGRALLKSNNADVKCWGAIAFSDISQLRTFIPLLVKNLRTSNSRYVRLRSARALGTVGAGNSEAIEALRQSTQDPDLEIAAEVHQALQKILFQAP